MDLSAFLASLNISATNGVFAIAAAVLSFVLMQGAVSMTRARLDALSGERAHRPLAEVLRKTLARTSIVAIAITAVLIGLSVLALPQPWNARVGQLWFFTLGLQLTLYVHRAVKVGTQQYVRMNTPQGAAPTFTVAHTLTIWLLRTLVWVIFALTLLANLGINVTTFVASLGIGGIAIALAVQTVLGDLLASLSIAADKPFEVGDFVSVSGNAGTIEHVGLKTTRIRALSGEQIVIANAEMLRQTVFNFKRMNTRRIVFSLRINPTTPVEIAAQVPQRLKAIVEKNEIARYDRAHLKTIDPNWLEYEVVYIMQVADYNRYMDVQQEINFDAMRMFDDLGISTGPRPQPLLVRELLDQPVPDAETDADTASRHDHDHDSNHDHDQDRRQPMRYRRH